MATTILGLFLVLHGLVHLLYFGLSRKLFELDRPLTGWPEHSWVLTHLADASTTRLIASVLYALAVLTFSVAGVAVLTHAGWWRVALIGAAVFSSVTIFLFWDGQFQRLPDKGFIGLLINVALLVVVFLADRGAIVLSGLVERGLLS